MFDVYTLLSLLFQIRETAWITAVPAMEKYTPDSLAVPYVHISDQIPRLSESQKETLQDYLAM